MSRTTAMFIGCAFMSAAASAQAPVRTFAELPDRLPIGAAVSVTTRTATVSGTVRQISDTQLILGHDSVETVLAASDVLRIARRQQAVKLGAFSGLAAGFLIGATIAGASECTYTCFSSPGGVMMFGGVFGAAGMGIGAVIGASVHRESVVFNRGAGTPRVSVTPWLSRPGGGLRMQLTW